MAPTVMVVTASNTSSPVCEQARYAVAVSSIAYQAADEHGNVSSGSQPIAMADANIGKKQVRLEPNGTRAADRPRHLSTLIVRLHSWGVRC